MKDTFLTHVVGTFSNLVEGTSSDLVKEQKGEDGDGQVAEVSESMTFRVEF